MSVPYLFQWADEVDGKVVDLYRGILPRSFVIVEFALETGMDQYAIASDKVLTESGKAGVELVRYFDHDIDPFDGEASIWLGCHDLIEDAQRYIARIGEADLADVWYLVYLDFSIGTPAVKHVLSVVQALPATPEPLRTRILAWSESPDFLSVHHAKYWGRQSPGLVQKRIRKQLDRLRWAAKLGPISGAGYTPGPPPPTDRPATEPRFPDALREIARKKKALPLTGGTPEEKARIAAAHAALHDEVVRYRNRRRRKDPAYVPWKVRLSRWIRAERQRHPERNQP